MVTILKNQLLKYLSRYMKNLSPEQISVSAFQGSGELQNLTLDEDRLTDLLELPGWVRLTSAKCNRVTFRIQWTRLKTVPVLLNLDEVHVVLEVCSEPRVMNPNAGNVVPIPGKYSFLHKVVDGISIAVNQVHIEFNCDAFTSSVQIARVSVESRTPEGRKGDLRMTRIKNEETDQLLVFKELEWQNARIEAKIHGEEAASLPPLRLLLGNTHCRIVIKKRISDCVVLGSRLVICPEPVAWALTDGQLRAALACAAALARPVRLATAAATRAKAIRKISEPVVRVQARSSSGEKEIVAKMFAKHDVVETSYHLLAQRIDLHLCDDPGLGRSENPSLSTGGALQVTLVSMQADLFPYHKATGDRRHWKGYRKEATPHTLWLTNALSSFRSALLDVLDSQPLLPSNKPSTTQEMPVPSDDAQVPPTAGTSSQSDPSTTPTSQAPPSKTSILQQIDKLMATCLVLRIDDFTVYKVSTGSKTREAPKAMICADKLNLPGEAGLLHAELAYFYCPGDDHFPVPAPKLFVQVSPVRVLVDVPSVVWLGAFVPHVALALRADRDAPPAYMDVRLEVILPRVVLEAGPEHVSQQRDRPKELHICTARVILTNVRESGTNAAGTRADLAATLSAIRRHAPAQGQFPCTSTDIDPINEQFILHADNLDDIERGSTMSTELLWREARWVWCARVEPLWAELCGARAARTTPLLDATPLTAWLCFEDDFSKIFMVCRAMGLAGLQLNHHQLLFLLRQLERISDIAAWTNHDARRHPGDLGSIVMGIVVPAVELTLVLPSGVSGQESSREMDTGPFDSSSLQDCKLDASQATLAPSLIDRDVVMAPPPAEVFQPAPYVEEIPPPSPGVSFGGFSSMRRGLNTLVTSIDSALTRDDARGDAASIAGSDSDRCVVVGLAAESPDDAAMAFREFEHGRTSTGVEVAAEVVERSSSPSDQSMASSVRRGDVISTCTFRLSNLYIGHQSADAKTALRLVADNLGSEECAAIPWDEFQSKFSMRARYFTNPSEEEDVMAPRETPRVAARLTRSELPRNLNEKGEPSGLAPFEELLEARVRDLSLALNMSTVLAMAELVEDEVVAPPMPLQLHVEDLKLKITEDRVRSINLPPPQPLNLDLSNLRITRDSTGVLHIGPPPVPSTLTSPSTPQWPEMDEAREKIERLTKENEELRKRLLTSSGIAEGNRELRAEVDEASVLRQCVHTAQQEVAVLLADKHKLLETIRELKEQLSSGKR